MKKINIEDFNKILADAKKMGYDLRMSDIFYTFELQRFDSKKIVYSVLFGKGSAQEDIDIYDKSAKIKFLKKYIETNYPIDTPHSAVGRPRKNKENESKQYEDITFEENKEALIKLLEKTQKMAKEGKIEEKDAIKIESDIRLKLNNYFNVSEKQDEQRIIVYEKFNHICDVTHKECWLQTKEFAMQHWGLIEDPNKVDKNIKDNGDE